MTKSTDFSKLIDDAIKLESLWNLIPRTFDGLPSGPDVNQANLIPTNFSYFTAPVFRHYYTNRPLLELGGTLTIVDNLSEFAHQMEFLPTAAANTNDVMNAPKTCTI